MQKRSDEDLSKEPNGDIVRDRTFTKPYSVPNDIRQEARIQIAQEPFYLTEADFLKLKHDNPSILVWANRFLLATIGFALSLLGEAINRIANPNAAAPSLGEKIVLIVAFCFTALLYLIGRLLPNQRKIVMMDIDKHFRNAPRSRQPFGEKK